MSNQQKIYIDQGSCTVCGLCKEVCPIKLYVQVDKTAIQLRQDRIPYCIGCGQCMAVCPTQAVHIEGLDYDHDFFTIDNHDMTDAPFMELITTRRAIRNYKQKAVPVELLEKVVEAITFAPPGFTPIKTQITVVQDPAKMRQALIHMIEFYEYLVKLLHNPIARQIFRLKVGKEKFNTVKNHVMPLMKNRLPELKKGTEDTITRHAPAMLLFHAHQNAENFQTDINIAITYAFLAAHALGLGATALDLVPPAVQNNADLRKLFNIPKENIVSGAVILGYPKYRYQRGIKRELEDVTWI